MSWPATALATASISATSPSTIDNSRSADALAEMLAPPGKEIVEYRHRAKPAVEDGIDEIRAEKTGPAGDEKAHGPLLPTLTEASRTKRVWIANLYRSNRFRGQIVGRHFAA